METNGNRNDAKWDAFEKMMEDKVAQFRSMRASRRAS